MYLFSFHFSEVCSYEFCEFCLIDNKLVLLFPEMVWRWTGENPLLESNIA